MTLFDLADNDGDTAVLSRPSDAPAFPSPSAVASAPGFISSGSRQGMWLDLAVNPVVKISVVVPVFNCEKYLRLLLASLLNQSEPEIEIIAVDDGSTDTSLSVLHEFAQRDSRIVVLAKNHAGPSAARNLGLAHARGQWIAFADSDDWLAPKALETWLRRAEEMDLDLLIGNGFRFVGEPEAVEGGPLLSHQPWNDVISGDDWIVRSVAIREWPHWSPVQLVSRKLLKKTGAQFPEGIVHEDILWTVQLALAARRIGFVRDAFYGYRCNPGSITGDASVARIVQRVHSYAQLIPHLVTAASGYQKDSALSRALMRHACREGLSCIRLLRKNLHDANARGELAQLLCNTGLHRTMLRGARNFDEFRRAIRGYIVLHQYSLLTFIARSRSRWTARRSWSL